MTAADTAVDRLRVEHRAVENGTQVAVIHLARPAKANALNRKMLESLSTTMDALASDRSVRAVVLTGDGRAFGAGADIAEYVQSDPAGFREFTRLANQTCQKISESLVPVIAAVNGFALGGAFELVLSCDVVVAGIDATFGLPELSLGLIPGWGGTQRLTARIGASRARYYILTGKQIPADEAHTLGIVHALCDGPPLESAVELATRLAHGPREAIAAAKAVIAKAAPQEAQSAAGRIAEEAELAYLFCTRDGTEGIRAFIDKRRPTFSTDSAEKSCPST